mgnify:FL=1|tara:strand:+ start:18520 stop:18795 length:276 start_codon:yes stop_codon:yes gene_type:complete
MYVKYFTKESLAEANEVAIKTDRNRSIWTEDVAMFEEMLYPVVFDMVHNGDEVRLQVCLNAEGKTGWIDIPFDTFENLPTIEVPNAATTAH